ncbi:hypothetical protein ACOSQ2_029572 [Xanthoceras sorbifolium]
MNREVESFIEVSSFSAGTTISVSGYGHGNGANNVQRDTQRGDWGGPASHANSGTYYCSVLRRRGLCLKNSPHVACEAVHEIPSGYLFQAQVPSKVQLLSAPIEQVVLDPPRMKTLQNAVTSPSSPRSMGTVAVPFVIEKGKGVASSDLIIDLMEDTSSLKRSASVAVDILSTGLCSILLLRVFFHDEGNAAGGTSSNSRAAGPILLTVATSSSGPELGGAQSSSAYGSVKAAVVCIILGYMEPNLPAEASP